MKTLMILAWTQWIALLIFMYGFLPIKQPMPGVASVEEDMPVWVQRDWMRRKVGQVVLVVIDALRADFVLPQSMLDKVGMVENAQKIGFLSDLVAKHDHELDISAFVARANAPTVTMPRIKALMTGSIPGFVDVILNFGSSRLEGDSLVEQWKLNGFNLTMFGDDTWLKLFPEHFMRHDGTTSFFVSDFTQVDLNVTRHLAEEIEQKKDWDLSVLHYLGLDHIGHVEGPLGSSVPQKLQEMGKAIQYLTSELILDQSRWKYPEMPPLVVVLGDHGMADAGSHGGSSTSEIMTPLVFITHKSLRLSQKSKVCKQADLVPTLAWMTGVPIPRNNLGSILFEESGSNGLLYNAEQIAKCSGRTALPDHDQIDVIIEEMVDEVEENLVDCNVSIMLLGIVVAVLGIGFLLLNDPLISLKSVSIWSYLHIMSLASTSFIEEEHQTVYFMAASIFATHVLNSIICYESRAKVLNACVILLILRISRAFNQTGDKWSHLPDLGDWLKQSHNYAFLICTLAIGALLLAAIMCKRLVRESSKWWQVLAVISVGLVVVQKVAELNSQRVVWPARLVYIMSMAIMRADMVVATCLVLAVLSSPHNIVLYAFHLLLESLVDPKISSITHNFLGWAFFFQLGNSNGLASIDVGAAYTGVSSFHPVLVGTLLAISTFSGPILWAVIMLSKSHFYGSMTSCLQPILLARGFEIVLFLAVVTIERHHLFVWTVFSPKLLYLFMAVFVVNIVYSLMALKISYSLKYKRT